MNKFTKAATLSRILITLSLNCIALIASAHAFAQSELIVMDCTYPMNDSRMTITLDLAAKKASTENSAHIPGTFPDPTVWSSSGDITGIADDKITFVTGLGTVNQWAHTLNRYTGADSVQRDSGTLLWACHKQQKQF